MSKCKKYCLLTQNNQCCIECEEYKTCDMVCENADRGGDAPPCERLRLCLHRIKEEETNEEI